MLRRRTVTAACALVMGVTAAVAAPASARSPQDDAAASPTLRLPPAAMVEAMRRDLGITAEQARSRIVNEARAIALEAKLRKNLEDTFAGSWVTGPTSSTLVVATTDASTASAISIQGAKPEVVGRSLTTLNTVKDTLDRAAGDAPDSTPVWYVDVRTNSVVVLTSDTAEAEAWVAASGADTSAVRVERSAERPRPMHDVRGGDAFYAGNQRRCTVGFSVTRGSTPGFVTAGHCAPGGSPTYGFNRVPQGTVVHAWYPGNDFAWVRVTSNWTAQPWVNRYGSSYVIVSGSSVAVEGMSVCRSGAATFWHCGVVKQRNASIAWPETVYQLTRTDICAEPGDSGGPFISGSQAQGVLSHATGDCGSGGTSYFQPVNEILSTYGLTLVTSGATGCPGYQQSYIGTLTSGQNAYQPLAVYRQTSANGTHSACLDGPDGADFDLHLQRWNGSDWETVASGTSPNPDETITYSGTPGSYRHLVQAVSGSGSFTAGFTSPA